MNLLQRIRIIRRLRNKRRNHLLIIRRNLRDSINPLHVSDERFIELYRFPKQLAKDFFDDISSRFYASERNTAIPAELRFLCALRFFASGCYQRSIGQDFLSSMSQSSVSRCVHEVADILNEVSTKYVAFPKNDELNQIKQQFYQIAAFPGIVGVIDGTHVRITGLKTNIEHAYYCRKGGHSINAVLICDSNYTIQYMNSKFPGTSHDAYIWRRSAVQEHLKEKYMQTRCNNWILGDSGFPLQPWLMTPIPSAGNESKRKYNIAHKKTRCIVERCIGILKGRFRCLLSERALRYDPTKAGRIINACSVLHNILIKAKVAIDENLIAVEDDDDDDDYVLSTSELNENHFHTQGRRTRQEIVTSNFTV